MKILFATLALAVSITITSAQTAKTPSSAQATPQAATNAASPSAEDEANKQELVEKLRVEQSYMHSQLVDKCFTYKLSPGCWTKFDNPAGTGNESGYEAAKRFADLLVRYAKLEGIGDLEALQSGDKAVEKDNRPQMDEIIKNLSSKFSLTLEAPSNCTLVGYKLLMTYPYEVMSRLGNSNPAYGAWSPKSGVANITVVASPTAKDIAVKITPDGKQYTVTGPALQEVTRVREKINAGLDRGNKNL